jgi:hypothetical protein
VPATKRPLRAGGVTPKRSPLEARRCPPPNGLTGRQQPGPSPRGSPVEPGLSAGGSPVPASLRPNRQARAGTPGCRRMCRGKASDARLPADIPRSPRLPGRRQPPHLHTGRPPTLRPSARSRSTTKRTSCTPSASERMNTPTEVPTLDGWLLGWGTGWRFGTPAARAPIQNRGGRVATWGGRAIRLDRHRIPSPEELNTRKAA